MNTVAALCAFAAADRKGFSQQLGRAIRRPSSTSDIPEEDTSFPPAASFPPAYTGASFGRPRSKVPATGAGGERPAEEGDHGRLPPSDGANGFRGPAEPPAP